MSTRGNGAPDLSIALIGRPGMGKDSEPDGDEGGGGDDGYEAMHEFMAAVRGVKPEDISEEDCKRALKAFGVLHDLHAAGDGEADEGDEKEY